MPFYVKAAIGLPPTTAGFQRSVQIDLDATHHGRQTEQNACENRHGKCESENRAIDLDVVQPRNISRIQGVHGGDAKTRDKQTRCTSEETQ